MVFILVVDWAKDEELEVLLLNSGLPAGLGDDDVTFVILLVDSMAFVDTLTNDIFFTLSFFLSFLPF
jgi:hypothetical protein